MRGGDEAFQSANNNLCSKIIAATSNNQNPNTQTVWTSKIENGQSDQSDDSNMMDDRWYTNSNG
jgi:hypothetical protein